ncbi:MAG: PDZ domain-containing protein, partial [Terriglobia bacterium]
MSKLLLIGHPYGVGFSALLLRDPQEILVDMIVPASPSYRAGLFPGDELLEVDGQPVSDLDEKRLGDLILKPDDHARELRLGIRRGTSRLELRIGTRQTQEFANFMSIFGPATGRHERSTTYTFGLRVFDTDSPRQVAVTAVAYPSPAFNAGLHVGDLIVKADGSAIEEISS